MKKTLACIFTALVCGLTSASAQYNVSLNGTAVQSNEVSEGDFAAYVVSLDGTSFSSSNFSFSAGDDLTTSASYGSSFALLGTTNVTTIPEISFLGDLIGGGSFSSSEAISSGDQFGIISFAGSSTSAIGSSEFTTWTVDGNWLLPNSGNNESFGNAGIYTTMTSSYSQGLVANAAVPEPSTYAAIAGFMAIGFAAYRRRRTK